MALTRRRAVAFLAEDEEGTAVATGSLVAAELAIDPVISFDTPKKRRRLANGQLSEQAPIEGLKSGTMSFQVEIAGNTTAASVPVWVPLVEACGFRKAQNGSGDVYLAPIGAFSSGTRLQDGETVNYDSTQSAKVFGTVKTGCPYVVLEEATAAPTNGATLTGATTSATVDTNGVSIAAPVALKPYSERTYSLAVSGTFTVARGDVLTGGTTGAKLLVLEGATSSPISVMPVDGTGFPNGSETFTGQTSGTITATATLGEKYLPSLTMALWDVERIKKLKGCRGTFSITAPVGEDARFSFTFTGAREEVADAAIPSSISQIAATPPVFIGGQAWIDDLSDPALREFSADIGAAVALRAAPSEASGYVSSRIGARAVGGSINPEATAEGALDIYEKARDAEAFQVGITFGTAAGNRVFLNVPNAVAEQANDEDQEGMVHDAISWISYSDTVDEEHELVIAIY